MRFFALGAFLVAVTAGAAADWIDRDQLQERAETPLPIHPLAGAREGDWATYTMRWREDDREPRTETVTWRVVAIDHDRIVTRLDVKSVRDGVLPGRPRDLCASKTPTVEEFFGVPAGEIRFSREVATVLGRTFPATRVRFTSRGADPRDGVATIDALLSSDVPGSGIVSLAIRATTARGMRTEIDYELTGTGNGAIAQRP